MEEEKHVTENLENMSEASRREFLTKVLAGAGAVAAAGLLSGAVASAAGDEPRRDLPILGAGSPLRGTQLTYQSQEQGHTFTTASHDLTNVLVRERMLDPKFAEQLASISVTLSWKAAA